MPQHFNWNLLYEKHIENRLVYLNYIDVKLNAKTTKTNKSRCTQCANNYDDHLMETSRLVCSRKRCNQICDVKFKVCHCFKTNIYYFFKLNEHAGHIGFLSQSPPPLMLSVEQASASASASSSSAAATTVESLFQKRAKRVMTPKVKKLVRRLILDFDAALPKTIESKIIEKYKHKIESSSSEVMPSLEQIECFVKKFRRRNSSEKTSNKILNESTPITESETDISHDEHQELNESLANVLNEKQESREVLCLDDERSTLEDDEVENVTGERSSTDTSNCVANEVYLSQYNWLAMQLYRNLVSSSY